MTENNAAKMSAIQTAFLKGRLLKCERVGPDSPTYICLKATEGGSNWIVDRYNADRDDFYFVTYYDTLEKAQKRYAERVADAIASGDMTI